MLSDNSATVQSVRNEKRPMRLRTMRRWSPVRRFPSSLRSYPILRSDFTLVLFVRRSSRQRRSLKSLRSRPLLRSGGWRRLCLLVLCLSKVFCSPFSCLIQTKPFTLRSKGDYLRGRSLLASARTSTAARARGGVSLASPEPRRKSVYILIFAIFGGSFPFLTEVPVRPFYSAYPDNGQRSRQPWGRTRFQGRG